MEKIIFNMRMDSSHDLTLETEGGPSFRMVIHGNESQTYYNGEVIRTFTGPSQLTGFSIPDPYSLYKDLCEQVKDEAPDESVKPIKFDSVSEGREGGIFGGD